MSILKETREESLRLGGVAGTELSATLPNGERFTIRRKPGVIVFHDIPLGANVVARAHRPASLNQSDALSNAAVQPIEATTQGFRFELAPRPAAFSINNSAPFNVPGQPSGQGDRSVGGLRVFSIDPANPGQTLNRISIPNWVPFAPAQAGALVRAGRMNPPLILPMPGQPGINPEFLETQRRFLRVRWIGTSVAAATTIGPDGVSVGFVFAATTITRNDGGDWTTELKVGDFIDIANAEDAPNDGLAGPITIVTAGVITIPSAAFTVNADDTTVTFDRNTSVFTAAADTTAASATFALRNDRDLAPGSIALTLPTSGNIMRDDGFGNLGSDQGDHGVIDYISGAFRLNFAVAETGEVLATYEHECLYAPITIELEWDAVAA